MLAPRVEPASLIIERACVGDAGALAALHREALPPGWPAADFAKQCEASNRIVLKAHSESRLLGLAVLQVALDEAELLSIAVLDRVRRRGVGARLLGQSLETAYENGARKLYLEVAVDNAPARELYRSFGFVEIARREGYYPPAAAKAALILMKNLERPCGGNEGAPVIDRRSDCT